MFTQACRSLPSHGKDRSYQLGFCIRKLKAALFAIHMSKAPVPQKKNQICRAYLGPPRDSPGLYSLAKLHFYNIVLGFGYLFALTSI